MEFSLCTDPSLTPERGWHMVLPKDTVEIGNSGSDGSLEMRSAYPISKRFNLENNSVQHLAQRVARESTKVASFCGAGKRVGASGRNI